MFVIMILSLWNKKNSIYWSISKQGQSWLIKVSLSENRLYHVPRKALRQLGSLKTAALKISVMEVPFVKIALWNDLAPVLVVLLEKLGNLQWTIVQYFFFIREIQKIFVDQMMFQCQFAVLQLWKKLKYLRVLDLLYDKISFSIIKISYLISLILIRDFMHTLQINDLYCIYFLNMIWW